MGLHKTVSADEKTITIKIDGMFDLSLQSEFRHAYEDIKNTSSNFVLDMRDTEYLDSAAFGMLLVFRDFVGGDNASITIVNANEDVKKSFSMLQFDRMFDIG